MFEMALLMFFFAFIYEICDSALGQGYGTLGSPTYILLGISSKIVVPAILISQAAGGLVSAVFHHKYKNADFGHRKTPDMKKVYVIILSGIVGVLGASFIGFKLPKDVMTGYIGVIVLVMGLLITLGVTLKFSWKKFVGIGAISAFNKGLSGGGYGPVVAGGQTIIGVGTKNSIGITDFAEAPICIAGFIMWTILSGLPPLDMVLPMCIGAALAPPIGAWITYKIPTDRLKKVMGVVIIILGILCLLKVLNP